jgi:hypothetical protein
MMRYRNWLMIGVFFLAAGISFYNDPDGGKATLLGGLGLIQAIWAVSATQWTRKMWFDYKEADMQSMFSKALESSIGAGLALIAMSIIILGLLLVFSPRAFAETPANYAKYGPVLYQEQKKYWTDHPRPALLAALVEQESCVSLKSKRCWSPSAQLKTDKEEGAGVGQLTKAYRADGSIRFDSLAGLRNQYSKDLGQLSWDTIYTRPDLQFRALVIMSRDSARQFMGAQDWLAFGDAGYNGGVAGVKKERRACAMTEGCLPQLWFGHVENHCLKSRKPLYGNRNACDINREHVRYVMQVRVKRYES